MPSVLDWSRFRGGSIGPEQAFEAFTTQLFERWLRRTQPDVLESYTLHGAGGDGGVEAFGHLNGGNVVGFQAKWFDGNLTAGRIKQIWKSVNRARETFSTLATYVIAIKKDLTKGRPRKKGSKKAPEKGGVERWATFIKACAKAHPGLKIVRWDEAEQLSELASPENLEMRSLWFEGELSPALLDRAWKRTRAKLRDRYLPNLHAVGQIDDALEADLWQPSWHEEAVAKCDRAHASAADALSDLAAYVQFADGKLPSQVSAAAAEFREMVEHQIEHANCLTRTLKKWPIGHVDNPPKRSPLDSFREACGTLKDGARFTHSHDWAERAADRAERAGRLLDKISRHLRESVHPRIIMGPSGCGKTHAVADAVRGLLQQGRPAVMVLAKDVEPQGGAAQVLANALDLPGWPLRRILDGLEALTTVLQLATSKSPDATSFFRCAIIVDGLEESVRAARWSDVLSDIAVACESRPRLHLVATMRPEHAKRDDVNLPSRGSVLNLRRDGAVNLPRLLESYARHFQVVLDDVPWLAWAVRSPLEVRLLTEEYRGRQVTMEEGIGVNLLSLFRRKLRRVETEARLRAGENPWPQQVRAVGAVLDVLSELTVSKAKNWFQDHEILREVQSKGAATITADRIHLVLGILREHGLADFRRPAGGGLFEPPAEFSLSTRHLADFVLATRLAKDTLSSIGRSAQLEYPPQLLRRPDAAVLFAASLATAGHYALDLPWATPPSNLETLHVSSLAIIPPAQTARRAEEIIEGLLLSTAANRDRLGLLILHAARIPAHPLGARLLDQALRRLPMPERDQLWSVPEHLPGNGVWAGWTQFDRVLDSFELADSDTWDGLPLVAAWTCSSVVESRRKRVREALATWGAKRLDQMALLVDHMADVDDPQIVDDIVVASLGAAVAADPEDSGLRDLANLIDRLFFTEGSPVWTTSAAVRRAGRGVVERAAIFWPSDFGNQLQRARPPYACSGVWPEADERELKGDSSLSQVVIRDLSWYVVKRAVEDLFKPRTRPAPRYEDQIDYQLLQAVREGQLEAPECLVGLVEPTEASQQDNARSLSDTELMRVLRAGFEEEAGKSVDKLSDDDLIRWCLEKANAERPPPEFSPAVDELLSSIASAANVENFTHEAARNALVAHLVRSWGWSHRDFCHFEHKASPAVIDDAIARRHGVGASHGQRSRVCSLREKYVWAAAERVAGALADMLPIWSSEAGEWRLPTNLEEVGPPSADPLPATEGAHSLALSEEALWMPTGVVAEQFSDVDDPAHRAEAWVTSAEFPDPRTLVRGPAGGWNDAAILSFQHYQKAHQYCIDELVQVRAFGISTADLDFVRRDARYVLKNYFDCGAWVEQAGYGSPALACWAPWLTWRGETQSYNSYDADGKVRPVDVLSAVGEVTAHFPEGQWPQEPKVWMPSPMIARGLGAVRIQGSRWHRRYVGRDGRAVAVERDDPSSSFNFNHHYLAVEMGPFVELLAKRGCVPAWSIHIQHEATPALWHQELECVVRPGLENQYRDAFWLVVGDPRDGELEVIELGSDLHRFNEESE